MNAHGPVLLAIEDDPSIVELLATIAEPLGMEVRAARDGVQALALLERLRPAVITLDLVLPDVDGFTVLEALRTRPLLSDVPVMVVSALADSRTERRVYEAGASDILFKPFNVRALEVKLRSAMRRARLEAELFATRAFVSAELERGSVGWLILDDAARVRQANAAAASILGEASTDALVGQPVAPRLPALAALLDEEGAADADGRRAASGPGPRGVDLSLGVRARPAGGWLVSLVERSGEDRAVREAEARVRHEALVLGARRFAHEVRNPLAAIAAAAPLLARADLDEGRRRRIAAAVEREALRVSALAHEHVDRLATPQPPVEAQGRGACRVAEVVGELVEVNLMAEPGRARVSASVDGELPAVGLDPGRLKQVLLNLVENALAATLDGGTVEIDGSLDGDTVRIEVTDTGEGMGAGLLARVFDDGFSTREGGRGLGLTIARRLVEEAGGTLSVESAPGLGTAFTVLLPAVGDPTSP